MKQVIRSIEDIKSGYVVELRNGNKFICMRYGDFKKCLISTIGGVSNIINIEKYEGLKFRKKTYI